MVDLRSSSEEVLLVAFGVRLRKLPLPEHADNNETSTKTDTNLALRMKITPISRRERLS